MQKNKPKKKGQVTIFIVIGVLLLIIAGIIYFAFLRTSTLESEREQAAEIITEPEAFKTFVTSCIEITTKPIVEQLSRQGGTLNLTNFRLYNERLYNYQCIYTLGEGCKNRLVTKGSMQRELNKAIRTQIDSCVDLTSFEVQGYLVQKGNIDISTTVRSNDVLIDLSYPLSIRKDDFNLELEDFSATVSSNLGALYDLARTITNAEIIEEFFNQDEWMDNHGVLVRIEKHKPYPDVVYRLRQYNPESKTEEEFLFATQGFPTVDRIGLASENKQLQGWCQTQDQACYANVEEGPCRLEVGEWSRDKPLNCRESTLQKNSLCNGRECFLCGERSHNESWCVYDSVVGSGFDYVGSRHYKQSCFDGIVYTEEGRDFREELCVEDRSLGQAFLKPNRWQTCASQETQESCEDQTQRDCSWIDYLTKGNAEEYGADYSARRCIPGTPPGFKHWAGQNPAVCSLGNELFKCDGLGCFQSWVDSTAQYCYSMGDCGNFRNIQDDIGKEGYTNTESSPVNWTYLPNGLPLQTGLYTLSGPFSRHKPVLSGQEFEQQGTNRINIAQSQARYFNWLGSLDYENLKWQYVTQGEINYHTLHSANCGVWNAPLGGESCTECGSDPLKPCTQYQCLSLGKGCLYEERDGRGSCMNVAINDTTPPTLFFDGPLTNISLSEDLFLGSQGFKVNEPLNPYTFFWFWINISEPASCKQSPIPGLSYDQIPEQGSPFNTRYPLIFIIKPSEEVKESLTELSNSFSTLQAAKFSELLEEMKADALATANEFGQNPSDIEAGFDKWINYSKNSIQPAIQKIERGVNTLLTNIELDQAFHFIKCIDRAGNENEQDFFVSYSIGEDKLPPEVVETGDSVVEDELNLVVYTNEPAECKYDTSDPNFILSQGTLRLKCPTLSSDIEQNLFYKCSGDIPFNESDLNVYVKCLDQPTEQKTFKVSFEGGDNFSVNLSLAPERINLTLPNKIHIDGEFIIEENVAPPTKIIYPASNLSIFNIGFTAKKEWTCRVEPTKHAHFEQYSKDSEFDCEPLNETACPSCSQSLCSTRIVVTGNQTMYFNCQGEAKERRNGNPESLALNFTR